MKTSNFIGLFVGNGALVKYVRMCGWMNVQSQCIALINILLIAQKSANNQTYQHFIICRLQCVF